ncbi:MAG: superoxide dismutase family protein [Winogradskyella sp.]
MKHIKLVTVALTLILASACKEEKKEVEVIVNKDVATETTTKKKVTITLSPKSDSKVEGKVTFEQVGNEVTMVANMTGLTEGIHAIHIHQTADCSSADGKSTGGHWNPTAQPHGKWGDSKGYHKGDIGNFQVKTDGVGTITMSTNEWCIGCKDETKNILGKAIIVHQGTDDFTSQPSGAAGSRISCGGIIE